MNTSNLNKTCCQPDAPWVKCNVCGKPIKTCESKEPIPGTQYTYVCPVHQDGVQNSVGNWECDDCHWEAVDFNERCGLLDE